MKIWLSLFFTISVQCVLAQEFVVSGKIIEAQSHQPIEYATISMHSKIDSTLLDGTVSEADGTFELTNKSTRDFYVLVQFIGYASVYKMMSTNQRANDLGIIELSLMTNTLADVQITGRAITSVHRIDKQVFDAGQFENAKGGSASDVLRNLPSVSINSFGEISVRGATGFLVMINDKPIQGDPGILLKQLSANSIEDIEIVTAPSAKYDPDGNAGIINIKTKSAINDGRYLNGNIIQGLPSIEPYQNKQSVTRLGADFTYNYQKDKWNFSLGADYKRYDISGRREGYVNTFINEILTEFPSDGERSFDEVNYSGRLGVNYKPTNHQSINIGLYAGKRTKDRTADILYLNQQRSRISQSDYLNPGVYFDLFNEAGTAYNSDQVVDVRTFYNENLRVRKSDFVIFSTDYSHKFSEDSEVKISGLYERTILGGPTDNANLEYPNTTIIKQLQFNTNDNPLDGYRFQLDWSKKFGSILLESGYQYRFLSHPGDFDYFDRDLANNVWIENPLFTNGIELTRKIHSLYSQVNGDSGNINYTIGLRLENFDRRVDIESPESVFKLNQWNIFPSLNLSYEPQEGLVFKAGYSRRIERTTTFKMTPFPEREHSETLEQGDAELQPEYIDLLELGAVKSWGDNSVFATAYFRDIENVINRVNTIHNDTILNRIYTNAGKAQAVGLEVGTTLFPAEKMRFYLGSNIFNYKIKGRLFEQNIETSNVVYSINANLNYEFSSSFGTQLGFNYLSERVTAQGRDSEFYNPSLTIRKSFMNKKLNVSLQWLNIDLGLWNANEQRITTEQSNFFTTTNYVYEVDILQLNFSYQLNQPLKNVKIPDSEFGKKEF